MHSGPEGLRHTLDVEVSKQDEVDTYLPAFRAAVVEGKLRVIWPPTKETLFCAAVTAASTSAAVLIGISVKTARVDGSITG